MNMFEIKLCILLIYSIWINVHCLWVNFVFWKERMRFWIYSLCVIEINTWEQRKDKMTSISNALTSLLNKMLTAIKTRIFSRVTHSKKIKIMLVQGDDDVIYIWDVILESQMVRNIWLLLNKIYPNWSC